MPELDARPEWSDPDLIEWLTQGAAEWKARLKGTALARAKRAGLLRNAALVLGTRGTAEAVAPLAGSSRRPLGRRRRYAPRRRGRWAGSARATLWPHWPCTATIPILWSAIQSDAPSKKLV